MGTNLGAEESVFRVGGLMGDHCRDRIEHTLYHLGGVTGVSVNLQEKTVQVGYDPELIAGDYIEETLQSLGYSIHKVTALFSVPCCSPPIANCKRLGRFLGRLKRI